TEATLNAIRAARVFTGRTTMAKVEGGYHGTVDEVMASSHPNVTVLPFNDVAGARDIIESQGGQLAAVLVEPVLGSAGMIPAERPYLEMLRETTRRFGIVLIFDEVVSVRVAYGGAQEYFDVLPDLTCLGKLIGGGFPLGAFGGRSDIMALFDPSGGQPAISHPGSHNAYPVAMVAGAATLELLTPVVIDQLNTRGQAFRHDLATAFAEAGIPAQITGLGSLFALHLTEQPVRGYPDTLRSLSDLRHEIFLGLYNEGILIDPRGVGNLSTAIGEEEIDRFGSVLRTVLRRVDPSVLFRLQGWAT
ncbi:MAG TPA: aminotransferase class III-fold pyridoxal phosphate-dependent enzyme, partial [Gemmatimonadales bacterium]